MTMPLIVVKIGSNVLTRQGNSAGVLDITRFSSLVDQIAFLKSRGYDVVLVSSGAVACGRSILGPEADLDNVGQRQVYSSVGQVRLMNLYHTLFNHWGITVGQVLTMKENFTPGKPYDNQKSCMEAMLRSGVLPIVNENDTVSITELMFTDNDELSGLVSEMLGAEELIILSNIDGVYDGNPSNPSSAVISSIGPDDDFSSCVGKDHSSAGRGGMLSKYSTARSVAAKGIKVIIANGKRDNILCDLIDAPSSVPHTEFTPASKI